MIVLPLRFDFVIGLDLVCKSLMSITITQLIQLASSEDSESLDNLLEAFRNYLRVTARVWIPDNLAPLLDDSDLVQETLFKAHNGFDQFRGRSEPELTAWLRRILSRVVVDAVRRHGAELREKSTLMCHDGGEADALQSLVAASATSPSQGAERRELSVLLADALAEMPDHYREVILLRNLKEKKWHEVASQMNREIGTARALWVRALTDLRERMLKQV